MSNHDRWSADTLKVPEMWVDVMCMSKWVTKNVRILGSCMTSFIAITRLRLSHWNSIDFLVSCEPHTTQLHIMGTSSLAIMPSSCHSGGHFHWSERLSNTAPQPNAPEASVWIVMVMECWRVCHLNKLWPFHVVRKVCHHRRSEQNSMFSLVK